MAGAASARRTAGGKRTRSLTMLRCPLVVWFAVLANAAPAADPQLLFADRFEGKLADGWAWLKQDAKAWRGRDGGLEVRVLPPHPNALHRPRPAPARAP